MSASFSMEQLRMQLMTLVSTDIRPVMAQLKSLAVREVPTCTLLWAISQNCSPISIAKDITSSMKRMQYEQNTFLLLWLSLIFMLYQKMSEGWLVLVILRGDPHTSRNLGFFWYSFTRQSLQCWNWKQTKAFPVNFERVKEGLVLRANCSQRWMNSLLRTSILLGMQDISSVCLSSAFLFLAMNSSMSLVLRALIFSISVRSQQRVMLVTISSSSSSRFQPSGSSNWGTMLFQKSFSTLLWHSFSVLYRTTFRSHSWIFPSRMFYSSLLSQNLTWSFVVSSSKMNLGISSTRMAKSSWVTTLKSSQSLIFPSCFRKMRKKMMERRVKARARTSMVLMAAWLAALLRLQPESEYAQRCFGLARCSWVQQLPCMLEQRVKASSTSSFSTRYRITIFTNMKYSDASVATRNTSLPSSGLSGVVPQQRGTSIVEARFQQSGHTCTLSLFLSLLWRYPNLLASLCTSASLREAGYLYIRSSLAWSNAFPSKAAWTALSTKNPPGWGRFWLEFLSSASPPKMLESDLRGCRLTSCRQICQIKNIELISFKSNKIANHNFPRILGTPNFWNLLSTCGLQI